MCRAGMRWSVIRGLLLGVLLGGALPVLSGCAETGDFGRRRPGLFEGKQGIEIAPQRIGARASLTDDEDEMVRRAATLLGPPERPALLSFDVIENTLGPDPITYYDRLAGRADLSVAARYARLRRDIANDRTLIPAFRLVACRVALADRRRAAAVDAASTLSEVEVGQARTRILSNAALGTHVEAALGGRLAAYRFAIERLSTASPDPRADSIALDLEALSSDIKAGGACPG